MDVHLRPPEPRDRAILRRLRDDSDAQAILMGHPEARQSADDVDAWLTRRAGDPDGCLLVIDDGGRCVGFVQLTARHRLDGHAHFGIALVEGARGQGLGTAAIQELVMHASRLGLRKLLCEVRADNSGARTLYERLGFREVGVLVDHYDDGTRQWDVVIMEALLSPLLGSAPLAS